jgi:hypothetical protein
MNSRLVWNQQFLAGSFRSTCCRLDLDAVDIPTGQIGALGIRLGTAWKPLPCGIQEV